jgi:hypothetical protein
MSTEPTTQTLRETVDALGRRLARITAAATSLDHVAADFRRDTPPADLPPLLDQLRRDLALASKHVETTSSHARRVLDGQRS